MPIALFFIAFALFISPVSAKDNDTLRLVALGDSLTAGYGLESGQDFATRLQESLVADGLAVRVDNAGVSGDTSAGGLARLDWAVDGDPSPALVIVALGANDMLRGVDPTVTKKNLSDILNKLKEKNIPALLVGMRSPVNMGVLYQGKFDKIYPELAKEHGVAFHPFFLDGVAMKADLNLADGIHPNEKGIAVMVEKMKPSVKSALKK